MLRKLALLRITDAERGDSPLDMLEELRGSFRVTRSAHLPDCTVPAVPIEEDVDALKPVAHVDEHPAGVVTGLDRGHGAPRASDLALNLNDERPVLLSRTGA